MTKKKNNRKYERNEPTTNIIGVVAQIEGLRRRVLFRCRELNLRFTPLCQKHGLDPTYVSRMMTKEKMPIDLFEKISVMLRMDEVDGWNRPFPKVEFTNRTPCEIIQKRVDSNFDLNEIDRHNFLAYADIGRKGKISDPTKKEISEILEDLDI